MAEVLRLREAARLIGVSPGRLYRVIAQGRLTAAPGGGPGKPTLVSLEAVQAFRRSEGLPVPDGGEPVARLERSRRSARAERLERSTPSNDDTLAVQALETLTGQYLAQILARQSDYIEAFVREELSHLVERVVEQVMARLAERSERAERAERSRSAIAAPKAAVLTRLRTMQAEGLSLQAMAHRLNTEGVPTLSGKGRWQKGTIGKLLAQKDT